MKKLFLSIVIIILFTGLTMGADIEVGKIDGIDTKKNEITVSIIADTDIKMGDILEVQTENSRILLTVTFPMQTVSKCKIKGKGKLSELNNGMTVFRYNKDIIVKSDSAAKTGSNGKTIEDYINSGKLVNIVLYRGFAEITNAKEFRMVSKDTLYLKNVSEETIIPLKNINYFQIISGEMMRIYLSPEK